MLKRKYEKPTLASKGLLVAVTAAAPNTLIN